VRSELKLLLRNTTLTALAFVIALGWSLYQVAVGVGSLITLGLRNTSSEDGNPPVSVVWGEHVFYFQPLLGDLITLAVVLAVVLAVQRRSRAS